MTEEQEKLTMNQRIEAFYRQSGGPMNPEIGKILEDHLMNGKDHGVPGKKETIKDAFAEVFLDDHSTKGIALGFLRLSYNMKNQWEAFLNSRSLDAEQIVEALKKERARTSDESLR
ncbi:MAG TPA: hypothetical protein VF199_08745 [Bacillales bacterium]